MLILPGGDNSYSQIENYLRVQEFVKKLEDEKKKKETQPIFTLGQTVALFCILSIPVGLLGNLFFAMMAAKYMHTWQILLNVH